MDESKSRSLPSAETLREHAELLANKTLLSKREIEWRAQVLAKAYIASLSETKPNCRRCGYQEVE